MRAQEHPRGRIDNWLRMMVLTKAAPSVPRRRGNPMQMRSQSLVLFGTGILMGSLLLVARSSQREAENAQQAERPRDPAAEATAVRNVPAQRPEQQRTEHDRSDVFNPTKPAPLNPALKSQPK